MAGSFSRSPSWFRPEPTGMLPDVSEPCNCIVFAHRYVCAPDDLGFSTDSPFPGGPVSRAESSGERSSAEVPECSLLRTHRCMVRRDDEPPNGLPDELDVQGFVVRPTNTLKVLGKASELCGVGKSGGKDTVSSFSFLCR